MNFAEYERLIVNSFVPKILIVTTDGVETACLKNSEKFTDLLRPYCFFPDEIKSIRGVREEPYELRGFRCQLVEASELLLSSSIGDRTEKALSSLVRNEVCADPTTRYGKIFSQISNREDALRFPRSKPMSSILPWYENYQNLFLQNIGVAEHEFFGHPVACMFHNLFIYDCVQYGNDYLG